MVVGPQFTRRGANLRRSAIIGIGGHTVAEKLNTGDIFPKLTLDLVDGTKLDLPDGLDARYKVILFYRGHW